MKFLQQVRMLRAALFAVAAGFLIVPSLSFSQTMPEKPTRGSGTAADPYQIYTYANLKWIASDNQLWDKVFALMNDIDASETRSSSVSEWKRIGDGTTKHFTGKFHGRGHTIKNITINQPTQDATGFFGSAAVPGVIQP